MRKRKRQYTAEFKQQALSLVQASDAVSPKSSATSALRQGYSHVGNATKPNEMSDSAELTQLNSVKWKKS